MNRRDILKATLLTPFVKIFRPSQDDIDKDDKSDKSDKSDMRIGNRQLIDWKLTCDPATEDDPQSPYAKDISFPAMAMLTLVFRDKTDPKNPMEITEEYICHNPGGDGTLNVLRWVRKIVRQDILQGLKNQIETRFVLLNNLKNNVRNRIKNRLTTSKAAVLMIRGEKFKLCSVNYANIK